MMDLTERKIAKQTPIFLLCFSFFSAGYEQEKKSQKKTNNKPILFLVFAFLEEQRD